MPYEIEQAIIFFAMWFLSSSFFFFPRLFSAVEDWMAIMVWP